MRGGYAGRVDQRRLDSLLRRIAPRGFDPDARTLRPWHRLYAMDVAFPADDRVPKVLGSRITVPNPPRGCPHTVVHAFFHEVGHVQMLFLDVAVLAAAVVPLWGRWLAFAVALPAWQFVWREVAADLYALFHLGPRNVWRGYSHPWRRPPSGRGGRAGA